MKTNDNYDLVTNQTYYTVEGQKVYLKDHIQKQDGSLRFEVIPVYEGTAMDCKLYPSGHTELCVDYEEEGDPILVSKIFRYAPTKKLDDAYGARVRDLEKISLSTGELKLSEKRLAASLAKVNNEIKAAKMEFTELEKTLLAKRDELVKVDSELSDKRQTLSEYEDSLPDFMEETSGELARLRKIEFQMQCLEAGGVDNWDGYDDSLDAYRERYPND